MVGNVLRQPVSLRPPTNHHQFQMEKHSFVDDKIKHLNPQIGSAYDLISLSEGVPRDLTVYDCVRYVARTLKDEIGFSGHWIAPQVDSFTEQPDPRKADFGWTMDIHLTAKKNDGEEIRYGVKALLRQVSEEWFMVRSVTTVTLLRPVSASYMSRSCVDPFSPQLRPPPRQDRYVADQEVIAHVAAPPFTRV